MSGALSHQNRPWCKIGQHPEGPPSHAVTWIVRRTRVVEDRSTGRRGGLGVALLTN